MAPGVEWVFRYTLIESIDKYPIHLPGQTSLLLIIVTFKKPLPAYRRAGVGRGVSVSTLTQQR